MKYLMSGDPTSMAKVIRENKVRIERGEIKFSPVSAGFATDDKTADVADDKYNEPEPDTKAPKAKAKRK